MKILITLLTLLIATTAAANDVDKIIDEILAMNGSTPEVMAKQIAEDYYNLFAEGIREKKPSEEFLSIVRKGILDSVNELLLSTGTIKDMTHETYKKYYKQDELKQLLAFYQSSIGQKMISVHNKMYFSGVANGRDLVASINPYIQAKTIDMLAAAGVTK